MLRRIVYILVPVLLVKYPFNQLQVIMLFQTFYILYYAGVQPHIDKRRQWVETANEGILMMFMYIMACFSDLVEDLMAQFNMGYAFVLLLLLVLFLNVLMIVIKTVEKWRRNRALHYKRKIYLHQL